MDGEEGALRKIGVREGGVTSADMAHNKYVGQ